MGRGSTVFFVNHDPSRPYTRSCRSAERGSPFGACSGTRHFVEVFTRQAPRSSKTLAVESQSRNQRASCYRRSSSSKCEKHHIHQSKSFQCVPKDIRVPRYPHAFPEYYVDGKSLPFVNFDVGPSWAGLIPVSPAANETRKVQSQGNSSGEFSLVLLTSQLFFWFFPPGPEVSLDDLIFWYAACPN